MTGAAPPDEQPPVVHLTPPTGALAGKLWHNSRSLRVLLRAPATAVAGAVA